MNEFGRWVGGCSNGGLRAQNISKIIIGRSTVACIIRRVFSQNGFSVAYLTIPLAFAYDSGYRACSSHAMDNAPRLPLSTTSCYWRLSFVRQVRRALLTCPRALCLSAHVVAGA